MKCKYEVRWFYSKGACLVLVWTLLTCMICVPHFTEMVNSLPIPSNWLILIPLSVGLLSVPLFGWLADAKFGNYKVFRAGIIMLFCYKVLNTLLLVLETLFDWDNPMLKWIHFGLSSTLFVIGANACIILSLPLGLDQMPDGSSSSIACYSLVCLLPFCWKLVCSTL